MAKDYSFSGVSVSYGGQLISGFADGEGVRIVMNKERAGLTVGIDGEGARAKYADNSGQVTLVLLQTSESNALLSAAAKARTKSILVVKDTNGDTMATALNAWIKSYPEVGFSGEITNREWVLESDDIDLTVGGSNE